MPKEQMPANPVPRDAAPLRLGVGICASSGGRVLPRLLSRLLQGADGADRADIVVVAHSAGHDAAAAIATRMGATCQETASGQGAQLGGAADRLGALGADLFLFLPVDGVPRTGSMAALRRAFAEDPELDVACMRQSMEALGRAPRWLERAANARARRGATRWDSGPALRAAAYRKMGGFSPIPMFADVALSKALRGGPKRKLVEDATIALSAGRWRGTGVLRCSLRNGMLRGLYEVGVSPGMLARLDRSQSGR